MKITNTQYFIMLLMVTMTPSTQLICSDFNDQIMIVPQDIIYADETEDNDELNTAVIYDQDEFDDLLNDENEDINDISSINSFDNNDSFDGLLSQ